MSRTLKDLLAQGAESATAVTDPVALRSATAACAG